MHQERGFDAADAFDGIGVPSRASVISVRMLFMEKASQSESELSGPVFHIHDAQSLRALAAGS